MDRNIHWLIPRDFILIYFGLFLQVANDLSNLTAMDKKQWEVNLTRGIAYRHGWQWRVDNAKNMRGLLKDFKVMKFLFSSIFFDVLNRTKMFESFLLISIKPLLVICSVT